MRVGKTRRTWRVLGLLGLLVVSACASGGARRAVSLPGLTIDDAALRQWRFLYQQVRQVEWMACLYGRVQGSTVRIDRSELADVAAAGYAEVAGQCRSIPGVELVGLAHSHPHRPDGRPSCAPSDADARMLGAVWRIVVVVCDAPGGALRIGYRAEGRGVVIRTLEVRESMPPLLLGGESSAGLP